MTFEVKKPNLKESLDCLLDDMIDDAIKRKDVDCLNAIADMLKHIVDNREEEA